MAAWLSCSLSYLLTRSPGGRKKRHYTAVCVLLPQRTDPERKRQRQRVSALVLPDSPLLSTVSNTTQIPCVLLHHVQKTRNARTCKPSLRAWNEWFQSTFIKIKLCLCPLMRKKTDRALNSHQIESRDVTSRHVFWANCNRSEFKTPLWLHANYKSNNSLNKCMFHQQFEESLSPTHLSKTLFLLVSCLPSNMWQEFKKLGRACYTVRRGEFT